MFKLKSNRNKGSVLVAVVGVLAVLSVMAVRFHNEMQMAMTKAHSKNLASDVRVVAHSGLQFVIAKLLEDGASCNGAGGKTSGANYSQLAIEEQMEMYNKTDGNHVMGSGASELVSKYGPSAFYYGKYNVEYINLNKSLAPGNINYMVEDLSGKLPIGHISQWFQRTLVSATLSKLMTGLVPLNKNTELFEDTDSADNLYDYSGRPLFLRSLVSYTVASSGVANRNAAGLPFADGILTTEELGSSYTWLKGPGNSSTTKITTDIGRNVSDYRMLSSSLTPFARFTFPDGISGVSFASINPLVMGQQNPKLLKALFNFEPNDDRLKMYFSVGFDADPIHGSLLKDDVGGLKGALADPKFFENNIDDNFVAGMTANGTSSSNNYLPFTYNARNESSDKRPLPSDGNFLKPGKGSLVVDKENSWLDPEFSSSIQKSTAYYVAMKKATERLARAFKGSPSYMKPADGVMSPIVTRRAIELAIIKAVFGNSILFVITDDLTGAKVFLNDYGANTSSPQPNATGNVNYLRLHKALENGEIEQQLDNVVFLENAFNDGNDPSMAKDFFVSNWRGYKDDVTGSKFTTAENNSVLVPTLGFYYDSSSSKYMNYLPHPQTNQKSLFKTFVSIGAAYTAKNSGSLLTQSTKPQTTINKLYEPTTVAINLASNDINDPSKEAYLKLDSLPGSTSVENTTPKPANYSKLYYFDAANVNLKGADFSPYETKIRMAVLVNLLNAILPKEVTPTRNSNDANASLFVNSSGTNNTLRTFINFDASTGQYLVNNISSPSLPTYMNGWTGGIKVPGMTFWKFGVHSTTFQVTIDAFKFDEACRLSSVVTFDNSDSGGALLDSEHNKFDLNTANFSTLKSSIFLNPNARGMAARSFDSVGQGLARYPTTTGANSWRILGSTWSAPYARGLGNADVFVPIFCYPEDVVNIGADGGSWHFVPHPMEPGFTRFLYGWQTSWMPDNASYWFHQFDIPFVSNEDHYDNANPSNKITRKRSYGAGSWLKWRRTFTKSTAANTLKLSFFRVGGNAKGGYVQKHKIEIIKISNGVTAYTLNFNTINDWGYQQEFSFLINVPLEQGDYFIKLTQTNDSNTTGFNGEVFKRIVISEN